MQLRRALHPSAQRVDLGGLTIRVELKGRPQVVEAIAQVPIGAFAYGALAKSDGFRRRHGAVGTTEGTGTAFGVGAADCAMGALLG